MHNRSRLWFYPVLLAFLAVPTRSFGGDWPMWRHDARRSAASPHALAPKLHLQWVREYPPLEPGWPDEPRMTFDVGYEPVVMGKALFFGSSRNDSMTAIDTETGRERWRYYADGPIRFAPVAWRDKVYFACDDGHLYCLAAATGELRWRFRGGPSARKVLGNERLISAWPARGAPVVVDDTVYFAASIWPFMGVFIYALDAETGKVVWENSGLGASYIIQPHNSPAFGGPAPQGYLVATGDKLLVPCGRSVPACLDRLTGELLYYRLGNDKRHGDSHVSTAGGHFYNTGLMFELERGRPLGVVPREPVMTDAVIYGSSGDTVRALDLKHPKIAKLPRSKRRRGPSTVWSLPALWDLNTGGGGKVYIKAGQRLYLGGRRRLTAVDLPPPGGKPRVSWQVNITGRPFSMIAADDKLFVVTLEGHLYCLGRNKTKSKRYAVADAKPPVADRWSKTAGDILARTSVKEGYCLAFGLGTGRLVAALARQSKLHIIGVDPDKGRVDALRKKLDEAGLYGHRIALHVGDALSVQFPSYLASLIVSEDPKAGGYGSGAAFIRRVFTHLRPYGGVACLEVGRDQQEAFAKIVSDAQLPGAELTGEGDVALLKRSGPLPGSANWTHQYADAANTCVSKDTRVKLPLGLLWFGGVSNAKILPRHGHGPSEQVVDGRLFIEGPDIIRALDVYTGRLLWEADLPGVGKVYDNQSHQPGANALGSNYVSVSDGIYIAYGKECIRLDPATGKRMSTFKLPAGDGASETPAWGHISVWEDLLIAGAAPVIFVGKEMPGREMNWDATSSKRLVVMDRNSGDVRWTTEAAYSFRHNAICVGGGKVFCIDRHPERLVKKLRLRGKTPSAKPMLLAYDVRKGTKVWSTTKDVFGTWLGYSEAHDLLLQAGRASRDMLPYEPADRMIVHRGKDGSVVWNQEHGYRGPCMLHGETIITQARAVNLLTGEELVRKSPLTGADMPWRYARNYGCGTAVACEHLITFRSAAAGYFDLPRLGGTGNLGGFKSGCTSNLIPANGVLNSPDYTRTCTCSYQNQCSLAFVHMPEVEVWTFNPFDVGDEPIKRVGINLGAPGDRVSDDGTLWLDYPSVGGRSPKVSIAVAPETVRWFRKHSSSIQGDGLGWVAASGVEGLTEMVIALAKKPAGTRSYTVCLHFCEPKGAKPGQRVFDVALQGKRVVPSMDIAKQAGGPNRLVVRTFKGIKVKGELRITLTPTQSAAIRSAVLCGIQAVAEGGS